MFNINLYANINELLQCHIYLKSSEWFLPTLFLQSFYLQQQIKISYTFEKCKVSFDKRIQNYNF